MANALFIPFDNKPDNTVQDSSTSYTCPTGYYAKATVSLNVSTRFVIITNNNITLPDAGDLLMDSNSHSLEIWLNAGDILSSNAGTNAEFYVDSAISTTFKGETDVYAEVLVNTGSGAVVVGRVTCGGYGKVSSGGGAGVDQYGILGDHDVKWHIQEYQIQT